MSNAILYSVRICFIILVIISHINGKISSGRFEFHLNHVKLPERRRLKTDNSTAPSRREQLESIERPKIGLCCNPNSWIPFEGCSHLCRLKVVVCLSLKKTPSTVLPGIDSLPMCELANSKSIETHLMTYDDGVFHGHNQDYHLYVDGTWPEEFVITASIMHLTETNETWLLDRLSYIHDGRGHLKDWCNVQMIAEGGYEVKISYRFICQQGHYGKQCTEKCTPRNSLLLGHYTCDNDTGRKICLDGWEGADCNRPKCNEKPCVNGRCIQPNLCQCFPGWRGSSCEQCVTSKNCQNGHCELDKEHNTTEKPFTCQCLHGWTGLNCDVDLRYCVKNPNTCIHGTCMNMQINLKEEEKEKNYHPYKCICKPGYYGNHCELLRRHCKYHGCSRRGACQTGICECHNGFYGQFCEFFQQNCSQKPCQGELSICKSISKANSSLTAATPVQGFHCICKDGRSGANCEVIQDFCSPHNSCLNDSLCVNTDSGYKCICPSGFTGNNCQTRIDTCDQLNCQNGGKCLENSWQLHCECPNGWTGPQCSQNINECSVDGICRNGGSCRDLPGSYACQCKDPFYGNNCEFIMDHYDQYDNNLQLSLSNGNEANESKATSLIYYVTFFLSLTLPILAVSLILILIYLLIKRYRKNQHTQKIFQFRTNNDHSNNDGTPCYFNDITKPFYDVTRTKQQTESFHDLLQTRNLAIHDRDSPEKLKKAASVVGGGFLQDDPLFDPTIYMATTTSRGSNGGLIKIHQNRQHSCLIIDQNFLSLPGKASRLPPASLFEDEDLLTNEKELMTLSNKIDSQCLDSSRLCYL